MYGNYGPIYTYPGMMGNLAFQSAPLFQSTPMFQGAPAMGMGMRQVGAMGARPFAGAGSGIGKLAGNYLGGGAKAGGILSSLKKFNWGSLLNNASKTLGVVNQAIPVVREFGPMMNNMRSMIKVASVFKDETDKGYRKTNTIKNEETANQSININDDVSNSEPDNYSKVENSYNSNEPNFFL